MKANACVQPTKFNQKYRSFFSHRLRLDLPGDGVGRASICKSWLLWLWSCEKALCSKSCSQCLSQSGPQSQPPALNDPSLGTLKAETCQEERGIGLTLWARGLRARSYLHMAWLGEMIQMAGLRLGAKRARTAQINLSLAYPFSSL